ncbi:class I SAM-dependent methyltransferase [Methanospirillum lacunae]|uniref:Class I SAM-dependent methyltransferase n=1 Tax=Methanospirillum lacunae TaxID=668570 RepID=A0A2V2MZ62_9EURY|nr:methyltransferase domain-containing protein [Methanospirillum lacunae]PWR72759.1 hypothetical protein DK846_07355 [Methanospirillum lacunae]
MNFFKFNIDQAIRNVQNDFPFGQEYMDPFNLKYKYIISEILQFAPPPSNILSIGAGPCDLEAILADMYFQVTAIDDLNDHWHLLGNNRIRIKEFAQRHNVDLLESSVKGIKNKDEQYDVVLLLDIIEHIVGSPRELLNYAISSLKPNGLLIIQTPNTASLNHRIKIIFGKSNQVDLNFIFWNIGEYRSHFREYTRFEMEQMLSFENLININSKMRNILLYLIPHKRFLEKVVFITYRLICDLWPNFRDSILISGRKPSNWSSIEPSLSKFSISYPHIIKYNYDNETDEDYLIKLADKI